MFNVYIELKKICSFYEKNREKIFYVLYTKTNVHLCVVCVEKKKVGNNFHSSNPPFSRNGPVLLPMVLKVREGSCLSRNPIFFNRISIE